MIVNPIPSIEEEVKVSSVIPEFYGTDSEHSEGEEKDQSSMDMNLSISKQTMVDNIKQNVEQMEI